MPRVHHVRKAAKDNSVVKKGEPYYWWKFRYGGKRMSATRPRQSQLTQSKWSNVYAAQEAIEDAESAEDLKSAIEEAIDTIDEMASEYADADEAMGGHQGDNYERSEHLENLSGELQNLDVPEEDDDEDDDEDEDDSGETWEDVQQNALDLDWDMPC